MKINPTLEKDLKTTALGRAKLKLFYKVSGREGYMPNQKQRTAFIDPFIKDQFGLAEFFVAILTISNCRTQTFKGRANLANFTSALKKLDQYPIDKPVLYQFKSKFLDNEQCVYVKGDKLRDVEGHVYTVIIFDSETFPDHLAMVEIRSSQSSPEPAFNLCTENGWQTFSKTDPEIFKNPILSICIDLLIDLANNHMSSLVSLEQVKQLGFKERLSPGLAGPKDKVLENLLSMLGQNKAYCFVVEIPLNKIIPNSYDHCFKIPLQVIEHAESVIKTDNFMMLIYEKDGMYIMSDCYPAYIAFRKMRYDKVHVVLIGKDKPKDLHIIASGGVELLPPIMAMSSGGIDNIDRGIKEILLDRYIKKLGVLDSSNDIIKAQCVVLTEDSKNNEMLESLLQSSDFNTDETVIFSYRNCTNLDSLDITIKMIKNINPYTTVLIHRDRDYLLDEEVKNIIFRIETADAIPFITMGTDIESYFINAHHIVELYPSLSLDHVQSRIDSVTQQTRDESIGFIKKHEHGERHKAKASYLDQFAPGLFDSNKARFRHGKKTLGILKSLLQKDMHENINLARPSNSLKDTTLTDFASRIWNY